MNKNMKVSQRPQRGSRTLERFKGKCDLPLKAGEYAGMDGNKKRPIFLNSSESDLFNSLHLSGEKHTSFQNLL